MTPHDISGENGLSGTDIGEAWLLPPTVLLQYHFDTGQGIKPYIGAGIYYTAFFNVDVGEVDSLDLGNGFGRALKAGVGIHLRHRWYLNVDVKKLWLDAEATLVSGGGTITADVDVDPWIIGVVLGYRFGGGHAPLN